MITIQETVAEKHQPKMESFSNDPKETTMNKAVFKGKWKFRLNIARGKNGQFDVRTRLNTEHTRGSFAELRIVDRFVKW